MSYEPMKGWAFAWLNERGPYITSIFATTRSDLISDVEKFIGQPWRKTYRDGGRAVKVVIQEAPND